MRKQMPKEFEKISWMVSKEMFMKKTIADFFENKSQFLSLKFFLDKQMLKEFRKASTGNINKEIVCFLKLFFAPVKVKNLKAFSFFLKNCFSKF